MPESSSTDDPLERAALARALFSPTVIALIGASDDASHLTSRPQRVLRRHGYAGTVVPIHPLGDPIGGDRAYRSIAAVPHAIDHAFVMLPASSVASVIDECCAANVKTATIVSAGFAETGTRGRRRQDAIVAPARRAGLRLLGPNSLGIVNVHGGVTLCANAVFEHETLTPGPLSVISQSGSMLGGIVTRAQERGLGFAKLVSVGNECDVGVGELVDMLVDDPHTGAILLFLEAFRDATRLAQAARRAFHAGKPVIALKLGRSPAGREATTTHTGAIAGPDEVAEAFFAAHGIIRVKVFEALFETAQLVLDQRPPPRRRVSVLTVSGGAAAMVVDQLGLAGIEVVPPPAALISKLATQKIKIGAGPITDLPMGRADGGAYRTVLSELVASEHCDAVVAVQGSNATYMPHTARERVLDASRGAKPLAVFLGPRAGEAMRILQAGGVASFRTPEACADAVRAYCDWRAPTDSIDIAPERVAAIRSELRTVQPGVLDERESLALLGRIGIPCCPFQVVQSGRDTVDLPFPLAAKILSRDIAHKTEVHGVELDIENTQALSIAIDAMLTRIKQALPDARIDGVLVQPMQDGLGEVIVGFRRDRDVGPVVMVGSGGIFAELAGGYALRLAPVSVASALDMIAAVPAFARFRGYRGSPAGDLAALAAVVHTVSLLALLDQPQVMEAEINPLIVRSDGVVAVDALIRIG